MHNNITKIPAYFEWDFILAFCSIVFFCKIKISQSGLLTTQFDVMSYSEQHWRHQSDWLKAILYQQVLFKYKSYIVDRVMLVSVVL